MDDEWGITEGYHDVHGRWHETPVATRDRLRAAMGTPQPGRPMWFVQAGHGHTLWNDCDVLLEDGSQLDVGGRLPHDLPIGYHELVPRDGSPATRLVVHPAQCPQVPRMWGVAAQVYALWSPSSWGVGDLYDLRRLAELVVAAGGGALLVSPLHQPAPILPQEPSPYYPSTRRAWSPLLLGIDAPAPAHLRCRGDQLIDRDDAWISKRSVLEAKFDSYLESLERTGVTPDEPGPIAWWNARCDVLRDDWRNWPEPDRSADIDPDLLYRARFHQWLQSQIEAQLAEVSATGVTLIGDLAVGFSPVGADSHEYRDLLALPERIGAPSDEFNPAGQNWGIPPFVPWRLRAAMYQPFIDTVRATLRGMGGLRIDHVMGLFRQYWVPDGGSPDDGAYVRFPADELLAILAIESTRAGAFVVGEDLGTVEASVHEAMARFGIAGTKVLWFEDPPPSEWPESALATVTTHDLPTVTQVFLRDPVMAEDEALGGRPDVVRRRLMAVAVGAGNADEAIDAAHRALLGSPSRLRLITTDDLAGAGNQPNLPGLNDYPSWRLRLPRPVDELFDGFHADIPAERA